MFQRPPRAVGSQGLRLCSASRCHRRWHLWSRSTGGDPDDGSDHLLRAEGAAPAAQVPRRGCPSAPSQL